MSSQPQRSSHRRRVSPPSRWLRWFGRHSHPIAFVFGLLTLATTVTLVGNLTSGAGVAPVTFSLVLGIAQLVLLATITYEVHVLPQRLDDWDDALAERARVSAYR